MAENEEGKKHAGGRPPLYNNCLDFDAMCERYFEEEKYLDEEETKLRPYLVTGLSLFLGMDTDTFGHYSKRPEFCGIVKKARDKISLGLQERSIVNPQQATGCLFNLKCNHGMKETAALELSGPNGAPIETSKVKVYIPENGRD